jgi:hypothetical protein
VADKYNPQSNGSRSNKPFNIPKREKVLGGCQIADTKQAEEQNLLKKRARPAKPIRTGTNLISNCFRRQSLNSIVR